MLHDEGGSMFVSLGRAIIGEGGRRGEGRPNEEREDCDQEILDLGNNIREYAGGIAQAGAGIAALGFGLMAATPPQTHFSTRGSALTIQAGAVVFGGSVAALAGYVDLVGQGIQASQGVGVNNFGNSVLSTGLFGLVGFVGGNTPGGLAFAGRSNGLAAAGSEESTGNFRCNLDSWLVSGFL